MSESRVREVYSNGHCAVTVTLLPDETAVRLVYYGAGTWDYEVQRSVRYFAIVTMSARDTRSVERWEIFPGNERSFKYAGIWPFRWSVLASETTQEERLESAIIEAIKKADDHLETYKTQVEAGDDAIAATQHIISAFKEVQKLSKAG